ncbi:MAG: ABC transporter ATP-binding protein, partial [Anaeroplasmataceae bacterium]|nr:ABC transporter ATP-binding protein [Anaeroplasmataceae bacterium]
MKLNSIYKKYKKSTDYALNNISLDLASKGLVILSGKSGSGKSTLINIISGLDTNYEGNVIYKNQNLKELSKKELNSYRNSEIGYIFQDFCLLENKTIYENLTLSLEIHGSKDDELIHSILKQFDLLDHIHKFPNELSGGEQQRVSIARAILKNPNILIADEPTSSLDEENAKIVLNILKEISKTKLVIVVTHNLALAKSYADRIIVLDKGFLLSDTSDIAIEETSSEIEFRTAKLPFKTTFFLSLRLKNNLFKMILTLFLFVICFTLTAICFSFATMDKDKILLKSMYNNNEQMASVSLLQDMYRSKNSEYEPSYSSRGWIPVGLEEKLSKNIDVPYLKINSSLETPNTWYGAKITFDEYYINEFGERINSISSRCSGYLDEKTEMYENFDFKIIAGDYPKNDDEVCLSLLVYEDLKCDSIFFTKNRINDYNDLLKYTVEIGNKEFKISGIFSVGNLDCSRYEHMTDKTLSNHQRTILSTEQAVLFEYSTYST